MRYSIALLLLFIFSSSSLQAQVRPPASALQASITPAVVSSGEILDPSRFALLQPDAAFVQPLPVSDRTSSMARHVGWGALLGASAGVLSSVVVLSLCQEYCEGNRGAGIAIHVGVGAAAGAGVGAVLHQLRR
jgi:hypothetical protein